MDLRALYLSVADGSIPEYLGAHPEVVSADVAEAAMADVAAAADAGRPDVIFVAATAAALIHVRLGNRERSLGCQLDAMQGRFMMVDDPDSYAQIRDLTVHYAGLAEEIHAAGTRFRCLTLAADCSWFAAVAVAGGEEPPADERLVATLADVVAAAEAAGAVSGDTGQQVWLERLASLVTVVSRTVMGHVWLGADEDRVTGLMGRLARLTDAFPIELLYAGDGGSAKAAQVAATLAELELRYGDLRA